MSSIDKKEFGHFKHLGSDEIEDIMCIYKGLFPLGKRNIRIVTRLSAC